MQPSDPQTGIPSWARVLLAVAATVIVLAGARAASPILMPFFIALFVSVVASGPLFWLEKKGVPPALAVVIVVLGILGIAVGVGALVGTSLNDFTRSLPEYQAQLEVKRDAVIAWLHSKGLEVPEASLTTLIDPRGIMSLTANLLKSIGGLLANTFLILLTVVFLLLELAAFGRKLQAAFGIRGGLHGGLDRFAGSVRRYVAIKTLVSLATGILITLWLSIIGVDFALLWGLLAFLLNFVPNLGSILAAIPAILIALIQSGPFTAILTAAGYLAVNIILGNFVEPRFMGSGLGLSPLIVFVSLVFWGWIFGPIGMLLSVLLTVTLKMALESSPETRWIALFMGSAESVEGSPPAGVSRQTEASARRPDEHGG